MEEKKDNRMKKQTIITDPPTANHFFPVPCGEVHFDADVVHSLESDRKKTITTTTVTNSSSTSSSGGGGGNDTIRMKVDQMYIWYILRSILRFVFVLANNLYCIPTHAIWMFFLLPLLHFNPVLYWYIEGPIFKALLLMVAAWGWTAGYRYYEVGEDVSSCYNKECLVLANHQSTGDVPSLMAAFQNKGTVVDDMMWIMDRMFKYTNFGLVSWIHGDFFIQAGKDTRQSELTRLRDHMLDVYCTRKRKWIVLFPEGGFLRKRKESSQRYAKKNDLPVLEYVTIPRIGALHSIVSTLHPNSAESKSQQESDLGSDHQKVEPLKWIIDVTIGYPKGKPVGLDSMICMFGKPKDIYLHYRRFPIEDVPLDETAMMSWLCDRFNEKEVLLREFYKTGSFPVLPNANGRLLEKPQPVVFDNGYIAAIHLLFILSTLFHWWLLSWLFTLLWPF